MRWTPLCANQHKQDKQLKVKTNRTSFYEEIVTDITTQKSERKYT